MAARTHSYTQRGRSSHRATLAVVCGLAAVVVIPLAIEATRRMAGAELLDAAWAIPVTAVAASASLIFARGVHGVAGSRRLAAARVLAVTGLCLMLSSTLAVGIYEFLVWKEGN